MPDQGHGVVVGLDNGGTTNNATVLDSAGRFLVDHMLETHSLVQEGPEKAIEALAEAFAGVLEVTGTPTASVLARRAGHPGAGQRERRHLGPGGGELPPSGLARRSTSAVRSRTGSACR